MNEEDQGAVSRRALDKLAWLSRVLHDVDDWLDSRDGPIPGERVRRKVTLENLDQVLREEGGSIPSPR